MKPIRSLYALKAIGCLFVVMIHVPFMGRGPASPIINAAVPLFLMISGYLLYEPRADANDLTLKLNHAIAKMVRIIIIVNAVYLLHALLRRAIAADTVFPIHSWTDVVEWILFGHKFNSTLWYLNTYLWTLVILWVLCRCHAAKVIRYLPLLLVLTLLLGRYLFVLPIGGLTFDQRLNCFTIGLPFVSIGYIAHQKEAILHRITNKRLTYGIVLCIVLAYAESLLLSTLGLNNHFGQFAFTIAYAILLFIGGITHSNSHVHPIVENIGKYHSGNIYYFHILIDNLFQSFGVFVPATQAILVFVVAWMLSIVLRRMQRITSGKKL